MAGIYIHIPFCRQACHYCDFHFSTSLSRQNEMINAIAKEIESRKMYVDESIETIYFGGGTPSLLTHHQLSHLLNTVNNTHSVLTNAEITLEVNPEDLTIDAAKKFLDIGINRLSIGVQTFDEKKLAWMNRVHDSTEAIISFENARKVGFDNISLDLIYAIPDHSLKNWEIDLEKITALDPEHVSLYGLTIENQTVFGRWEQENKLIQVPESEAAEQYLFAIDYLKSKGFLQYEVSNFGKKGFHSRHNHAYWLGLPYLGVGPGAHSFDGDSKRQFNIRNNSKYLRGINENKSISETEDLSTVQRINEQILTQLRTARGLDLSSFNKKNDYAIEKIHSSFISEMISQDLILQKDGFLRLLPKGFLVADEIALRLFLPE